MVELGMIIFFHWKYDWNMLNIGSAQNIDFRVPAYYSVLGPF